MSSTRVRRVSWVRLLLLAPLVALALSAACTEATAPRFPDPTDPTQKDTVPDDET